MQVRRLHDIMESDKSDDPVMISMYKAEILVLNALDKQRAELLEISKGQMEILRLDMIQTLISEYEPILDILRDENDQLKEECSRIARFRRTTDSMLNLVISLICSLGLGLLMALAFAFYAFSPF